MELSKEITLPKRFGCIHTLIYTVPDETLTMPRQKSNRKAIEYTIPIPTYGPRESLAYTATRIPNAYAAHASIFSQIASRLPDYSPRSILDFGTGPGTGLWAAKHQWNTLDTGVGVDVSEGMISIASTFGQRLQGTELAYDNLRFQRQLSSDSNVRIPSVT